MSKSESEPSARDASRAVAKLAKCRLLDPEATLAICADHREAGCASASQLKASWKHLRRAAKGAGKAGVTIAAIPTQCVDVCRLGPLLMVTRTGEPPVWYGAADEDAIDAIVAAIREGEPLPEANRLAADAEPDR